MNQDANGDENEQCISDGDLDNIVGVGDSSGLKVFSFPRLLAYLYPTLEIFFGKLRERFCNRKWKLHINFCVSFVHIKSRHFTG